MADANKDRTNQTPLSSGTQTGLGDGLRSNSTQSTSPAGASEGGMSGKAFSTASVKESGARLASEAKHYADDMANRAKEKGRSMFEQQKETAVGQVESVAHAFRNTADKLQGEGQDQAGRYISIVADQLESFTGRLRQKDLDTLIGDTQDLARRAPGAFLAGTVVAGFLLARFLKSSSDRQRESLGISNNNAWSSSSTPEAGTFSATPAASATPTSTGAGMAGASDMAGVSGASSGNTPKSPNSDVSGFGASSTPGISSGTTSSGALPSSLGGSSIGGNSHDNR